MENKEYQANVDRLTMSMANPDNLVLEQVIGLIGEVGELANKIKKIMFYDHPFDTEARKIKEELGDIFWYATALCSSCRLSVGEVMEANIDKLDARFPAGTWSKEGTLEKKDEQVGEKS